MGLDMVLAVLTAPEVGLKIGGEVDTEHVTTLKDWKRVPMQLQWLRGAESRG